MVLLHKLGLLSHSYCLGSFMFGGKTSLIMSYKSIKTSVKVHFMVWRNAPNWVFYGRRSSSIHTKCLAYFKELPRNSFHNCECSTNVRCMIGHLTNKTSLERNIWVQEKGELFLEASLTTAEEKSYNRFELNRFLIKRRYLDLYEIDKTINIRLYFSFLFCRGEERTPLPWVGMFINPIDGRRIFKQSSGIVIGSDGVCYVWDKNLKFTLDQYKKLIFDTIVCSEKTPEHPNLKPNHLIFVLLKIGEKWNHQGERENLISSLSVKYGPLVYNFSKYTSKLYTSQDISTSKDLLLKKLYSGVALNVPVRVGNSDVLSLEYQYCVYPSLIHVHNKTHLCINQLIFSVVSSTERDAEWYLVQQRDWNRINDIALLGNRSTDRIYL